MTTIMKTVWRDYDTTSRSRIRVRRRPRAALECRSAGALESGSRGA